MLGTTAVSCADCGTEIRGHFHSCDFCALDTGQRELLRVFLAARGNTKELERHLGVSYPTARARLDDLLRALRIQARPERGRREILDALASGDIDVDEALGHLEGLGDPR